MFACCTLSKSGVVKKCSLSSILSVRLWENMDTCFLMYRRNASLFHRPMIMMVSTGTFARYSAIAAPDLIEWHPMSIGSNPSASLPINRAAILSLVRMRYDVISIFFMFPVESLY